MTIFKIKMQKSFTETIIAIIFKVAFILEYCYIFIIICFNMHFFGIVSFWSVGLSTNVLHLFGIGTESNLLFLYGPKISLQKHTGHAHAAMASRHFW